MEGGLKKIEDLWIQMEVPQIEIICGALFAKKPRHTIDKCWKLHGKPVRGGQQPQFKPKRQSYMANSQLGSGVINSRQQVEGKDIEQAEFMGLKQEEIEKLRNLLGSLEKEQGASSSNLALTGITLNSSSLKVSDLGFKPDWVLDTGATDHMTYSSQKFLSYKPCPSTKKIVLAYGSLTTVVGIGDISVNNHLILRDVLHVPKLYTNLISIKKLTQDANCLAIFSPNSCEFQERDSRKMIGYAKVKEGLYYLKEFSELKYVPPMSFLAKSNKDVLWLHHFRLGHPSFVVLQSMYPSLFKGLDSREFQCDICQFAKHKRASFPLNNTRSVLPFNLIHSDIWGPSPIPNISGARWFVLFVDDCTRVVWLYLLKNK